MQTTNTIDGNSISVIRLLDQSGTTLLDSISAEYEDSFCIESFGELIRQAANAEPKGND